MPCCLYRRNCPLVTAELRSYALDMDEAEKRMQLWKKNAAGHIVLADRLRAEDENINNGNAYPFETYYGAQGLPIPHPVQCTKGEHSCAIHAHTHRKTQSLAHNNDLYNLYVHTRCATYE